MSKNRPPHSKESFLAKLAQIEAALKSDAAAAPPQPDSSRPGSSQPADEPFATTCRLQGSINQFAFDLFAQRLQEPATGNALISPASIALALGMLLMGAVDRVEADVRAMLHISALPKEEVNRCLADLQHQLMNADDGLKLAVANSLWSALGRVALRPSFVTACREAYNAEVATLDFAAPETLRIINGWVSDHTETKIPSIVAASHLKQSILVLINALYFKGRWQIPFDPDNTQNAAFTLADGTPIQAPMMSCLGEYWIYEDEVRRAVRLPYGKTGRFGMVLLLPGEGHSLADLATGLNSRSWLELLKKLRPRRVNLTLPRFKMEDNWNLVRPLKTLGMASAFEDQQGFQSMMEGPAVIGDTIHKVFMEVNEEGTEAAAVTAIMMTRSMPASFQVDRPFALIVHDEGTGTILFLGQVMDPS